MSIYEFRHDLKTTRIIQAANIISTSTHSYTGHGCVKRNIHSLLIFPSPLRLPPHIHHIHQQVYRTDRNPILPFHAIQTSISKSPKARTSCVPHLDDFRHRAVSRKSPSTYNGFNSVYIDLVTHMPHKTVIAQKSAHPATRSSLCQGAVRSNQSYRMISVRHTDASIERGPTSRGHILRYSKIVIGVVNVLTIASSPVAARIRLCRTRTRTVVKPARTTGEQRRRRPSPATLTVC